MVDRPMITIMKQFRRLLALVLTFSIIVGSTIPVAAESLPSTQEIKVTAVVPSHRDIVLDNKGRITQITSNTLEDVTPGVYAGDIRPQNKKDLTPALMTEYRKYVPDGTAKYGTLYEAGLPFQLSAAYTRNTRR
jgi:hypothetical protein